MSLTGNGPTYAAFTVKSNLTGNQKHDRWANNL